MSQKRRPDLCDIFLDNDRQQASKGGSSDPGDQTRAHRVGDDVSGDLFQVFFAADRIVMNPILPDGSALGSANLVDLLSAVTLGLADNLGELAAFAECKQPVQVVWQDDKGQAVDDSCLMLVTHGPHQDSAEVQIEKSGARHSVIVVTR